MVRGPTSKHKLPTKGSDWITAGAHNTSSARVQPSNETPTKKAPLHINTSHQTTLLQDSTNLALTLQRTSVLVPKALDQAPDPRLNLYVKGLPPNTTSASLYEKFKPYGNILSCKIIVDYSTGRCKGGFVLFDSQESCTEARRDLTREGLYVAVAHDSVSLSKLHYESPTPTTEEKPLLDDSAAFPGLPGSTKKAPDQTLPPPSISTAKAALSTSEAMDLRLTWESAPETDMIAVALPEHANTNGTLPLTIHERLSPNPDDRSFTLGHSFLDFDDGFIGTHQQLLSNDLNLKSGFRRRPSLLEQKTSYSNFNDIDRYMNALELANGASAPPQIASNTEASHQFGSFTAPHISSTVLDDFMSEERPKQRSTVRFEDLPENVKYLDLFYLFSQYGPLVLSSVDIRDINEQCPRTGVVSFESHTDAEFAVCSLSKEGYRVSHAPTPGYHNEPMIDEQLYHQYYQQHQEMLLLPPEGFGSPLEPAGSSTFPTNDSFGTPPTYYDNESETPWENSTPEFEYADLNVFVRRPPPGFEDGYLSGSTGQEKFSMVGISPTAVSLSPSSSVASYGATTDESTDRALQTTQDGHGPNVATVKAPPSDEPEPANRTIKPGMSYSAIVRVPPKPKPEPKPVTTIEDKRNDFLNPPSLDLKRRGNTNKSLDEKEYNLNLFLKDLEPTMDEFKLYEICIKFGPVMSCRTITTHHGVCTGLGFVMYIHRESVERAIEGMKELGYHAEVAIQSATNKLRCKVRSDTLFLQNIPPHIKENKLRELFKPYHIEHCNVLRDHRTGKGKGVAFLK
ncbi:hypothetical protein BGZ83_006743 [Gryganskiella cystojenkinii]|nr:hypothetical protein BGZ83_006743 [Gryganskiella cystojenkinii]